MAAARKFSSKTSTGISISAKEANRKITGTWLRRHGTPGAAFLFEMHLVLVVRVGRFFSRLLPALLDQAFQHFRIGNRRGDHVSTAGPFAQINHAAAIAAEREVFVALEHQGAAGWAA